MLLAELIEKGTIKNNKDNATDFDICNQMNCKLIKIKAEYDYWALYFKNKNSLFKIPIYRLPEYSDKNFVNYKVGNYYNIKFKIENAVVSNIIDEKEEEKEEKE